MINEHRFLYTVLLALVRHKGKGKISIVYDFDKEILFLNGNTLPFEGKDYTEEGIEDRLHFLALDLGIRELTVPHAHVALKSLLKDRGTVSADEIIDVIKSSTLRKDSTGNTIKQWRQALEMRVIKAAFSHFRIEWLHQVPEEEKYRDYLESGPLLEKWPRCLLEDKFWAYTEPGFPGTAPFRLDEIWTDLALINPEEQGDLFNNMLESSFTALLDYRYEQRQWFAEPAEYVMELLQGATAITGPPGSGKTTMLKWLARQLILNPDGKFLLPLFVPLRQYALTQHPANNKCTGILDYALQTVGITSKGQRELWQSFLDNLSGSQKDNILLLLDGWDEVPAKKRELLKKELTDLGQRFSYVITSRPSAYPRTLPTERLYEIAELPWDSIYKLVIQWFAAKKEPALADAVLQYLDRYPDLKRLARSPFLLSLICGYTFSRHHSTGMPLPRSRTQLYRESVRSIIELHNSRYPGALFEDESCRRLERLAYWLFTAAPNAPGYTFDLADIEKTGGNKLYMEKVLKPSRFITRNDFKSESYHFLHTTFQEYFAACHIAGKSTKAVEKIFQGIAFDSTWQEIFSFAAGCAPQSEAVGRQFWRCMKEHAAVPDLFGFIYIQLTRFVAEAGAVDGGAHLLGVNLLEKLWEFIISEEKVNHYVDAYISLDPPGYVQKIKDYISQPAVSSRLEAKLLRTLGRVKTSDTSDELVRQILTGKKYAWEVASYQLSGTLDHHGLQVLLTEAVNRERTREERKRIVRALGNSGRLEALNVLSGIAKTGDESSGLVETAIFGIGYIGGDAAVQCLKELYYEKEEHHTRVKIVSSLGNCRCLRARDFFLFLLTFPPGDHDITEKILLELSEMPINRGSEMLSEYLNHELPGIRGAAAAALVNAAPAKERVTDVLIKAANEDQASGVREQALASLKDRARPKDGKTLARIVQSGERSDCEKANALRALAISASRCRALQDGPWLHRLALDTVRQGLNRKKGDLALEAAQLAYLLGNEIEPLLLEILKDTSFSPSVLEYVIESLGKLKCESALPLLLEYLNAFPNVRGDEDEVETNPRSRLAQQAAQALANINPTTLLNRKGSTAHNALADFALKNGLLVYDDRILDTSEKDTSGIWDDQEDLKTIKTYPGQENKGIKKKKILFLSANQVGAGRLRLDRELREIEEALNRSKNRDRLELIVKLAIRYEDIRRGLLDHEPQILHFSGHGSEKGLKVLDEVGVFTETVSSQEVSQLLKIFKEKVGCVVLSSCYSARLANKVSKYIPYVIGMKKEIHDNAAIAFSVGFYDGIGAGRSIEDAFKLGCQAIRHDDSPDESSHSVPVLKKRKTGRTSEKTLT